VANKLVKINDPIHGFIILPDIIAPILDSEAIQRLSRVRQLAGANFVFPGANHTRFEHCIGVAALAQRLINSLKEFHDVPFKKDDINDGIVAALCHDVGHGPFSHNFESILIDNLNQDHEDFTHWIITTSELGQILTDLGFNKRYIADLAVGRAIGTTPIASLICQVISSAVNVDSMDYLTRDNYHCGTKSGSIDINRLILAMDQIEEGLLGIDIRSLIAIEGFLLARISSFRTIYFHKTCRAAQLMMTRAMEQAVNEIGLTKYKTPEDFIKWDDYTLWTALVKCKKSASIMGKLRKRELLKLCYESQIALNEDPPIADEILPQLVQLSGIPSSEIFIDLPTSPNVPYSHFDETRPNEVFTFDRNADNEKFRVNLEDYSIFFNSFRGQLNLIRIYTWPQFRNQLQNATLKILGPPRPNNSHKKNKN
jgi:HD superfamily phosphohydrolase